MFESHVWEPPRLRSVFTSRPASPRLLAGAAVAAFLAVALGWMLIPGRPGSDAHPIRLAGPGIPTAPPTVAAASGELRVAVAALLSPRRSLATHGKLLDVLGARLGRPVRVVQRRTYAEVNELLLAGDAAIGFVCAGAFVAAEDRGLEALAVPVVQGMRIYRSYIIARAGLAARNFDELRGRTFAFMDPLSNSGCLYPSALLAERRVKAADFFSRVVWTGSHEGSIEAVARGLVDAAAVDSRVYGYLRRHNPDLMDRTQFVAFSPPFGMSPVVASPRVPAELKARVKEILLGLGETPDGRSALADLEVDRFEEARVEDYASVRALRAMIDARKEK